MGKKGDVLVSALLTRPGSVPARTTSASALGTADLAQRHAPLRHHIIFAITSKRAARQFSHMSWFRVGIALLKGQWEEAVRLIMQPSSHERADSAAAKQLFLNQADIPGALKAMPRHCVAECAILEVRPVR